MNFAVNPIIIKELRSRMRGARAFIILTAMLLLLGGLMYAAYRITLVAVNYSTLISPVIGQTLFSLLAVVELLAICFITPALTAGAISSERESLTYEMLLTTPLRPSAILWGKLVSALSYVFLLIFAAIPLASLVFIFGGVAPWTMLRALGVLVIISAMLGVIGIFMSAWLGRTARATIASYLVVLALLLVPTAIFIAVAIFRQDIPPREILILNPISALFSAMMPTGDPQSMNGVISGLGMILAGNLDAAQGRLSGSPRPLYHYSLTVYALITLALYLLAAQLVKPTRRWRLQWRGVALALLLFGALGGSVALAFYSTSDQYAGTSWLPTPTPFFPERAVPGPAAVQLRPALPTPTPILPGVLPSEPTVAPLSVDEQVTIYGEAIRQLLTAESLPLPAAQRPATLYLMRTTDDPETPQAVAIPISDTVQAALSENLAPFSRAVAWIESRAEITETTSGDIIITLGHINLLGSEQALVTVAAQGDTWRMGQSGLFQRTEEGWAWVEARATWQE